MKIIILTGQTATGKTTRAEKLANNLNGEIVNFDSRHVYRHLNIVTGKYETPTSIFAAGLKIKNWMFDIVEPDEYFSSFDYKVMVMPIIESILKRGKIPILVGGSYFYLKHLLYGIVTENIPADPLLRQKLNKESVTKLQAILKKINPKLYQALNESDNKNPQRLIRKIEISLNKQKNLNKTPVVSLFNLKNVSVSIEGYKFKSKESLKRAITERVDKRLKMGALDEVRSLLKNGFSIKDPGLKTIGYPQLIAYLDGKIELEEAKADWINKEIQYAKRQLTFMKKDSNINWQSI